MFAEIYWLSSFKWLDFKTFLWLSIFFYLFNVLLFAFKKKNGEHDRIVSFCLKYWILCDGLLNFFVIDLNLDI